MARRIPQQKEEWRTLLGKRLHLAIRDREARITHYVTVKEDITARKQTEAERVRLIQELQAALANVKA